VGKIPHGYLEFKDTYGYNFNGSAHVFKVKLFNGVVDDITESHIIPEIDMAAPNPEITLSQHTGQLGTYF